MMQKKDFFNWNENYRTLFVFVCKKKSRSFFYLILIDSLLWCWWRKRGLVTKVYSPSYIVPWRMKQRKHAFWCIDDEWIQLYVHCLGHWLGSNYVKFRPLIFFSCYVFLNFWMFSIFFLLFSFGAFLVFGLKTSSATSPNLNLTGVKNEELPLNVN